MALSLISWEQETFAFAESFDEDAGRYRGLRVQDRVTLPDASAPGLLVKPDAARQQLDAESASETGRRIPHRDQHLPARTERRTGDENGGTEPNPPPPPLKRFHGAVALDATRVGRDASQIADEVIAHLAGLVGAHVTVTLEIQAQIPDGAPDQVVRTVTENSRTLNFTDQGFERE